MRFPARASQLGVVRRLLTAWLEAAGTPPDDIAPTVLAVSEAASNAIEHAYGPSEGWFELDASLVPVEAGRPGPLLTVTVRDGGRWRNKPPGEGGLGIGLMARLMDEFETRRSEQRHGSVDAPRAGWEGTPTMNGAAGLVNVVPRVDRSVPICEVEGEIDASNVESVFDQLVASASSDSPGLVLDLTRTVYLDSAGVRILFELARRLRTHRQELRIAVPADGIVRRVLVLTALADVVPLHADAESAAAVLHGTSRTDATGPRPGQPSVRKWSVRPVISRRRVTGSLGFRSARLPSSLASRRWAVRIARSPDESRNPVSERSSTMLLIPRPTRFAICSSTPGAV